MSRPLYLTLAFVIAIILTVIGASQTLIYKITPIVPLALWFPSIVLTGAGDLDAIAIALIQFPLFATAFTFATRRWPVARVLPTLLLIYGLLAGTALLVLKLR